MGAGLKLPIVVDTREPHDTTTIIAALVGPEIPFKREHLDSGDYLLMDRQGRVLGIERKTVLDFLGSIKDGRLESQLERMARDYEHRLLVLQGEYRADQHGKLVTGSSWSRRPTGFTYVAFQAKLLAIQGRYAVRVLTVRSDEEFAAILRVLYQQGQEGKFHV